MGRLALIARLVARDLRHRPAEAVILLLAITAAATTLTLGLVLHGITTGPYERTRTATVAPDIVASVAPANNANQPADLANLTPLAKAPGVIGSSGPYPVRGMTLRTGDYTVPAMAEGRGQAPSAIDRPLLTAGTWARPGSVVLERSFAAALGVKTGQTIFLNDRGFRISGIAVSAALPPYPALCNVGCDFVSPNLPSGQPGLVWMTKTDLLAGATPADPVSWYMNLRLANPASAGTYATAYDNAHTAWSAPYLVSWQRVEVATSRVTESAEGVLLLGSALLALLAIASVAVLAGGRMAGQVRRVGLLKAVGATPGLVAVVLLAEHLLVAAAAACLGLALGWLAAPLVASPGAGLLGSADVSVSLTDAGVVVAVALVVALLATVAPAIRGARASTVRALDDAARTPKRRPVVTRVSRRMPPVLLLGLRIAARRPRRSLLGMASVTVTVAGLVTVLMAHAKFDARAAGSGALTNPVNTEVIHMTTVITVALVLLAAVNALLITWATVLDARRSSALSRALGATAAQVSAGLAVAQMLPALTGAIVGTPLGFLLYAALKHQGGMTYPPVWWLACVVLGTPLVVGALTVIPSRAASRTEVASVLQSGAA
jgi:ABC-type lipoprotein release transport system permease subunit